MKGACCMFVALIAGATLPRSAVASPIAKTIQMISDLQLKINTEGAESQKTFEEFTDFCEKRSNELQYEIKTGKAAKLELEADIGNEAALQKAMTTKIDELAGSIATDEGDLKAGTKIRKEENGAFVKEEKELVEVIDMVERAINIIEREMQKGGATLVQLTKAGSTIQALNTLVQASALGSRDATKLAALVQDNQQDFLAVAPDAAAYEGHSDGIISTLQDILEKAEDQLSEARKKESTSQNNFEMLKQSLEDDIKFSNKEMDETKQSMASSGEAKATAEGDLVVTSKDLEADIVSLGDLHKQCVTRASDFESSMKERSEELKALAAAKKVLLEKTGGAEKVAYGLDQTSFLQLSSETDLAHFEAVRLINDLARKEKSVSLSQLAKRIQVVIRSSTMNGQDPFGKVKSLISDMIAKLEKAATADATEKAYCDQELPETRAKKDYKTGKLEGLVAKIDQMSGRSDKLKEEVVELQKGLAEVASAQGELDMLRAKEEQEFTVNKAAMEQGLEGVRLALKVLGDYYGSDTGGAAASILGMLEVVEADLSKGLAELIAAEDSAKAAYKEETTDNFIAKASNEADVKFKTKEAAGLDAAVADAESDKQGIESELDPLSKSLKVLESRCIAKAETYAERSERRKAELAGLKEALSTLEGQAVLLQQTKMGLRRRSSV